AKARKKFIKKVRGFFDNKPSAGKVSTRPPGPPSGTASESRSTLSPVQHSIQPHEPRKVTLPGERVVSQAAKPFEHHTPQSTALLTGTRAVAPSGTSSIAQIVKPAEPLDGRPSTKALPTPSGEPAVTQAGQPLERQTAPPSRTPSTLPIVKLSEPLEG